MSLASFSTARRAGDAALRGVLAAALLAGPALAQAAAPNAADVSFASAKTVLWLGRTQILPLHLKNAAESDAALTTSVLDPRMVEIIRTPVFMTGEQTAYIRVRALQAGQTRLQIHGGPALDLDVKPDPAEAARASINAEARRPEIVSPMPGAAVWGEFGVGVSMFDSQPAPPADGMAQPAKVTKVQLRLPNGRLLDPISATGPELGPEREYQFSVPSADLPAGPLSLVAVASTDAMGGLPSRSAVAVESAPLTVRVALPAPGDLWTGECESVAVLGTTKSLYAPGRPARFGVKQPVVANDPNASGGKAVRSVGNAWCLPFIVKTAGDYQMMIQARSDFAGGTYPTAALYLNGEVEEPAGLVRFVGLKYRRVPIGGPVHLEPGPNILSVQFKNGFNQGKENRDLVLDRYELARVDDGLPVAPAHAVAPVASLPGGLHTPATVTAAPPLTPATAPRLNILYPANGAEVFGADAVVARVAGGTNSAESVDLLVDGQLQHVEVRKPGVNEPILLPLIARGLEPGDHRIAVRATVASGQTVDSPEHLLVVLPAAPAIRNSYERAVWLLDRLAFGPEPKELAAILTQGESKWLAARLLEPFNNPAEQDVMADACKHYSHLSQTTIRALDAWMNTTNPVRTRFTAWVENHFSTWITKTKPEPKWAEHLAFARLGISPFSDLLEASAHSAAMLTYLDQEKSYASKINENYAREIMELHTLGVHGGYRQADVTELANVLNGWTLADDAQLPEPDPALRLISDEHGNDAGMFRDFRFVPALNDGKPRHVLGLDFAAADPIGRYDRVQVALEMLASHPSTAEHVCRKLAEHYVGVPAPDALVHHLAATFEESGGDMRVVLYAMVGDPGFWSAPPKVATPFDNGMRAARLTRSAALAAGVNADQFMKPEAIENFLKHSGMGLFDRVTPDGYPENSGAYADSNALLQRWRFMQTQAVALTRLIPPTWRRPPPPADPDDLNHLPAPEVDSGQRFIDLAAFRLTGRLLTASSNAAARDVLGQATAEDLQQTLIFVSLLPETSLR